MSEKNKPVNSLKNRFTSIEREMNTDAPQNPIYSDHVKRIPMDLVNVSNKTIKTYRKSVDNASRQLDRNRLELLKIRVYKRYQNIV